MNPTKHTKHCLRCFDRVLPKQTMRFHPVSALADGRLRAIAPIGKTWINGSTLRVKFFDGDSARQDIVREQAGWWTQHANLKFDFNNDNDAEIRIRFDETDGAWSYIGTDCKSIPFDQPTMNLGFIEGGTAAHEIGHCLSGDTLIDCPRDLEKYPQGIPIKDLVGQQPWVYAWKDGTIVVRKASRVWLSKNAARTVRVKLGTGQGGRQNRAFLTPLELVGTPDHPVLLADGITWKPLGELVRGDRLCSMYRQKNSNRTRVYWTGGERVREHVLICEQVYGQRPLKHDAHHKNERMMDQRVDNLQWKHESDHSRDHSTGRIDTEETRLKRVAVNIGRRHTPETRAHMSAVALLRPPISESTRSKLSLASRKNGISKETREKMGNGVRAFYANGGRSGMYGKKASPETRAKQSASSRAFHDNHAAQVAAALTNHTVISVEPAEPQDVYDMTVPGADSFIANGVVVHNSIGLAHEHSSPAGGIQWNEAVVIAELSQSPNFWDEQTVRHNVFDKYAASHINSTAFDPDSIMLYAFPASWTLNGVATHSNEVLSAMDKAFISGAKMYPKTGVTTATSTELKVNAAQRTKESIGKFGEEDVFRFTAVNSGRYQIDTTGPTDVVMKLFGPDVETALIAEDDDSGVSYNACIVTNLIAGMYFVQVRHYNRASGVGKYSIKVRSIKL